MCVKCICASRVAQNISHQIMLVCGCVSVSVSQLAHAEAPSKARNNGRLVVSPHDHCASPLRVECAAAAGRCDVCPFFYLLYKTSNEVMCAGVLLTDDEVRSLMTAKRHPK